MTSTEGVTLQVDDVYVPLGLVERKKPPKRKDQDETSPEQKLNKFQGDISPEKGSELYKETEVTKKFEHNAFLEEVLRQKNTPKSQGKRIAIIGEPGAGKTTLLQQIADWVSRKIPQSIVIWVSLADLQGQKLEDYLLTTWLTAAVKRKGKAKPTQQQENDFVALFNQKNVWLLLDGLDEMSASNPLTEISRQFRESGLIYQARIVLTCRVNLWDSSINALDDFDIYRTLDFSYPVQVEKFINKWFAAILEGDKESGQRLCLALKDKGKERIQDLVKNPLRLTMLCFIWQSREGKLPNTQAGLYQQFFDNFYKWKKNEFATTSNQRQQLNIKLGELAKAAIDREINRFRLQQNFVNIFLGDADDENSLLKLALKLGWLNCVGIDINIKPVYAFFHTSFQEYFAAKTIDDWHFFLKHVPKNPSRGIYRIFEPQWKQTILLWLGREEEYLKQQKQQFMDAVVNFKDGCKKLPRRGGKGFYEYKAYFLAAVGIAEFQDYFRADEIIEQIVKENDFYFIMFLEDEVKSVLQQTERTKVITASVDYLLQSTTTGEYISRQLVKILGEIGTGNEVVITALLKVWQSNTVDGLTRSDVAESLKKVGTGNEKAIKALVQLLQSNNLDDFTRSNAVEILMEITGNKFLIKPLVELLQSTTVDEYTRSQAAEKLVKISTSNEVAINASVELLQSTMNAYTFMNTYPFMQAAENLVEIGTGNEVAINALVELLQSTTMDAYARIKAAESLGKIDPGNKVAIQTLMRLLQWNTYATKAAESLEKIDLDNNIAINALVEELILFWYGISDREAAKNLGIIDPGHNIAINALEELLLFWKGISDREVAKSLGEIGTGSEVAIKTLVELELLLDEDVNEYTRWQAAESLGRIDPGNEVVVKMWVQLLQSATVDEHTRWQAAKSLGEIGTGNEDAIKTLVELLQSTTVDEEMRCQAAESLGRIDPGNEVAINSLLQLLQSDNLNKGWVKELVAKSLGEIGTGNEFAINSLVQMLQSDNLDKKWVAQSLWEIGTGNEFAINSLVQMLQSNNLDNSWVERSLGKIGTGNEFAIKALLQLLQSTTVDEEIRERAASCLTEILQNNPDRFKVVKVLSSYWRLDYYYYNLAWKCAQNMPYPDFYQAWHQHNFATRTMRSLKQILFTRII